LHKFIPAVGLRVDDDDGNAFWWSVALLTTIAYLNLKLHVDDGLEKQCFIHVDEFY